MGVKIVSMLLCIVLGAFMFFASQWVEGAVRFVCYFSGFTALIGAVKYLIDIIRGGY